jgi:hypothetical protein
MSTSGSSSTTSSSWLSTNRSRRYRTNGSYGERADGLEAICVITFHELSERLTRVMVTYESHPHGLQKATSTLRPPRRTLRVDLLRFKSLVEVHPDEADELFGEPEDINVGDYELDAEDEPERQDESDEQEGDEPAQPKARRRPQASGGQRRQSKESPEKEPAQARKRTVRSRGAQQSSGSGSGARRQSKPGSKTGPSRARTKG